MLIAATGKPEFVIFFLGETWADRKAREEQERKDQANRENRRPQHIDWKPPGNGSSGTQLYLLNAVYIFKIHYRFRQRSKKV